MKYRREGESNRMIVLKTIGSAISRKYRGYCEKHNFNPIFLLAGIILFIILMVFLIVGLGMGDKDSAIEPVPGKMIKIELKDIGELATQAVYYTNVQVIEDSQNLWGWEVPLTHTESVFSMDGVIKVGYDFSMIEIEVDEEEKKITVSMPAAIIISNELLPESMRVYDEDKNIFTPISLETYGMKFEQIKQEAEVAAIERGMFESAKSNAEILIKGFLSGMYDMNEYSLEFVHEEQEAAE